MISIKQYNVSLKEKRNNKASVKTPTEVKQNQKSTDDKSSKLKEMVDKIKSLSKSNPEEAKKLLKTLKLANKDNVISEKTIKELEDLFIKDEETKNDGTAIRSCEEFSSIEIRSLEKDDGRMVISGYVNEVGKLSQPMRDKKGRVFREKIEKGVFKRAIDRARENNNPIKLLFRHNSKDVLASTKNASLTLEEDDVGLRFEAYVVNTTLGKDVYECIRTDLISNMSFGFIKPVEEWSVENGQNIRTLKDLILTEISILDNPAYLDSNVKAIL